MEVLVPLVIALLFGLLAYFICVLVPFTQKYANLIALIVAVLVFLARLGEL